MKTTINLILFLVCLILMAYGTFIKNIYLEAMMGFLMLVFLFWYHDSKGGG